MIFQTNPLHLPRAVANIQEHELPVVAANIHPAVDGNRFADVLPKLSNERSLFHIAYKITHLKVKSRPLEARRLLLNRWHARIGEVAIQTCALDPRSGNPLWI